MEHHEKNCAEIAFYDLVDSCSCFCYGYGYGFCSCCVNSSSTTPFSVSKHRSSNVKTHLQHAPDAPPAKTNPHQFYCLSITKFQCHIQVPIQQNQQQHTQSSTIHTTPYYLKQKPPQQIPLNSNTIVETTKLRSQQLPVPQLDLPSSIQY